MNFDGMAISLFRYLFELYVRRVNPFIINLQLFLNSLLPCFYRKKRFTSGNNTTEIYYMFILALQETLYEYNSTPPKNYTPSIFENYTHSSLLSHINKPTSRIDFLSYFKVKPYLTHWLNSKLMLINTHQVS